MPPKAVPPEAKEALRELVEETLRRHAVITYKEAAEAHPALPKTGTVMGKTIGSLLAQINDEVGSFISAAVVQKGTFMPGPGFFTLKGAPRSPEGYNRLLRRLWRIYAPV
jgi:hypothetical protein